MSLRSPIGLVRGLGSAKEGVSHWWSQRLTAIALVPLTLWFAAAIAGHVDADHAAMTAWMSSPITAALFILLIVATFYHAYLGLQVVIEDYVHSEGLKIASVILIKGACIVLALIGVLSVLTLLFEG
ncbi:succinate dehydrogenase, hydrophobic membrane anchor protein [Pelagibius sp. Alg239-R121]|uniref:succinate dehydrogenase, hydrophobic membrane anchor protein n=1 Tax=Pelagibius sp. Alg239-R121 TaxID=2993448 RepID=UPI0024A68DF0|nr:succinate dehydrogenase, hydrophobic membrane anchor protein [Pelagibius sp. Alg239-R121]